MIETPLEYYNRSYAGGQLDRDEAANDFRKVAPVWKDLGRKLRVIDLGCGAGSTSAELVRQGHEVVGLDIMEDAVVRARRRGLDAHVHDMNQPLPFRDGEFDVVMALDVLEHLFDPVGALRDIRRILREDGYAIVCLPLHFDLRNRLRLLVGRGILSHEHLRLETGLRCWSYYHLRFFTLTEAERFLAAAGLREEARWYRALAPEWLGPAAGLWRRPVRKFCVTRWPGLFAHDVKFRTVKEESRDS